MRRRREYRRDRAGASQRPGQDLRRLGALAQSADRAPAAALCARRRWHRLCHRARPDLGAGRRIGLRQEHGGAAAGGFVRAHARHGQLRRPRHRPDPGLTRRPCLAQAHADDFSRSVRQPEPALEGARHRWRAAARTWSCHDRSRAGSQGRGAAGVGGHGRGRHGEIPAPVLRRPAPAHLDRPRAGDRARVPDL